MQIANSAVQLLSSHPQRAASSRCMAQQAGTQAGPLFLLRRRDVQVHAATSQLCESAAKEGLRERLELSFQLAEPIASLPLRDLPGSALLSVELEPPRQTGGRKKDRSEDFYANVGSAIRTLRDETPLLFQRDLSYDIYREDITFRDPRNAFTGKRNYRILFWSLRFHGRLFFRHLYVDVQRIWQPEDKQIRMRWTVHGVPRVPWNAEGIFDGISTFRLDGHGKIYEHQVDNVILRDPPMLRSPLFAGLNLLPMPTPVQQPCPGAWYRNATANACQGSAQPDGPPAVSSSPPSALADESDTGALTRYAANPAVGPSQRLETVTVPNRAASSSPAASGVGAGVLNEEVSGSWLHMRAPLVPHRVSSLVQSARCAANARGGDAVGWLHLLQQGALADSGKCAAQPPYQAGAGAP